MARTGRPTQYTEALAHEICDAIRSSSLGLKKLCQANPHWPHKSMIMQWRAQNPSFADLYTRAKQDQIECFVDEIIEISDDSDNDTVIKTDKHGNEFESCNSEWINRSRLRVDSRKWLAAKLAPKIYGDKALATSNEGEDFISKNRDKI